METVNCLRCDFRHKDNGNCTAVGGFLYGGSGRTLPDVAPVVHGRWISLTECSNAGVYCSICHKKVYKEDYAWCNRKNKVRSSYCPHCGAKMDGDGNG